MPGSDWQHHRYLMTERLAVSRSFTNEDLEGSIRPSRTASVTMSTGESKDFDLTPDGFTGCTRWRDPFRSNSIPFKRTCSLEQIQ